MLNPEYEYFLVKFTTFNGYYTVPIISAIGFILNVLSLLVILHFKSNHINQLKYLNIKLALEAVACLFGIGFQNSILCLLEKYVMTNYTCDSTSSYALMMFKLYGQKLFLFYLYVLDGAIEIYLTLDRLVIFKNRMNIFSDKKNFKYILTITFVGLFIICLPFAFSYEIKQMPNVTGSYQMIESKFGKTPFCSIYILLVLGSANILTLIILIPATFLVAFEFNRFIASKRIILNRFQSVTEQSPSQMTEYREFKRKKAQLKIMCMTFALSFIFLLVRLTDLAATLCHRLILIQNVFEDKSFMVYLLNINYIFIPASVCANFFILIIYNKKFRKTFFSICSLGDSKF